MARFSTRQVAQIETTYRSDLGALRWVWIMRADGAVLYRLSHVNSRPERNDWQMVCQLTAAERRAVGSDGSKGAEVLTRIAKDRGHFPVGTRS